MWKNFKEMPLLLRFLTAHALSMAIFVIGSILPIWSFGISGKRVTYAEWWSSGAGVFASIVGILFPISGYLMLNRIKYARLVYIGSIILMLLCQVAVFGLRDQTVPSIVIVMVTVVCLLSAYLYLSKSVNAYFVTDKEFQ